MLPSPIIGSVRSCDRGGWTFDRPDLPHRGAADDRVGQEARIELGTPCLRYGARFSFWAPLVLFLVAPPFSILSLEPSGLFFLLIDVVALACGIFAAIEGDRRDAVDIEVMAGFGILLSGLPLAIAAVLALV